MGKERKILDRLAEVTDLEPELLPGKPVVEIAGTQRVLIENHWGVKAYSRNQIVVKVGYGTVCVQGDFLELLRMTRDQVVIKGEIQCVRICRKGQE